MKTIFDKTTGDELIARINTLNENSRAQWGKMTVHQMLKHCISSEGMIFGTVKCKRVFLGRLIGRMALKGIMKDDKPMMRNAMSSPELVVKESGGDIAAEKAKWIALIKGHGHYAVPPGYVHPFFGVMTKEQIGILAYKHIDHHLRQFNS